MTCCSPGCWAAAAVAATGNPAPGPVVAGDVLGLVGSGLGEFAAGEPDDPDPVWFAAPVDDPADGLLFVCWPRNFHAANPPPASTRTAATAKPIHAAVWFDRGGRSGGPGWRGGPVGS